MPNFMGRSLRSRGSREWGIGSRDGRAAKQCGMGGLYCGDGAGCSMERQRGGWSFGGAGTMSRNRRHLNGGEQPLVRIEDLPDLYRGRWVLVQVVEQREYAPVAGIVLAVGSEEHIQSVLMDDVRSRKLRGPYFRYYCPWYNQQELAE